MESYHYLNLEQKMLKIRMEMPALLKKFYNDEADYDFATLDDIYESMTPELNKYGVNFDIVKEIPTQYNEAGQLVYLTLDKDGYWRYEADLELCWINVDRPEECRYAVIHIVGTNEIPDKAHGTALTYALKYYFRNKFCMRQIGSEQEDPDYTEYDGNADGRAERRAADENTKETEKAADRKFLNAEKFSRKSPELEKLLGNAPIDRKEEKGAVGAETTSKVQGMEEKKDIQTETSMKSAGKTEDMGQVLPKGHDTSGEKPVTVSKEAAQTKTAETQEAKEEIEKIEDKDGFIPANAEEVPFAEDVDFMEELKEELDEDSADSDVEAAKKFKCDFGLYKGKTLEQVMDSGLKGIETLKWIVNKYKGPNKELVNAAKILLNYQSELEERKVA